MSGIEPEPTQYKLEKENFFGKGTFFDDIEGDKLEDLGGLEADDEPLELNSEEPSDLYQPNDNFIPDVVEEDIDDEEIQELIRQKQREKEAGLLGQSPSQTTPTSPYGIKPSSQSPSLSPSHSPHPHHSVQQINQPHSPHMQGSIFNKSSIFMDSPNKPLQNPSQSHPPIFPFPNNQQVPNAMPMNLARLSGAMSAADLESKLASSSAPKPFPSPVNSPTAVPVSPSQPHTVPSGWNSPSPSSTPLNNFANSSSQSPISILQRPTVKSDDKSSSSDFSNFNNNNYEGNKSINIINNQQRFPSKNFNVNLSRGYSTRSNFQPFVKATKFMSYMEIECILQMQELQLLTSNPYVDDFYFQCALARKIGLKRNAPIPAGTNLDAIITDREPLYDISNYTSFTRRPSDVGRVLGRIPSHNVRAPRTLLEIKPQQSADGSQNNKEDFENFYSNSRNSKKIIENVFDDVLDVEDINSLLAIMINQINDNSNNSNSNDAELNNIIKTEKIYSMNQKKSEILGNIIKKISLFIPTPEHQPTKKENWLCSFEEDEALLKLFFIPKGIRLMTRLLPLIPVNIGISLFLFFMRNFYVLITICNRSDHSTNNKFFFVMAEYIKQFTIVHAVLATQTILSFHTNDILVHTFRKTEGSYVITTLMSHVNQILSTPSPRIADAKNYWLSVLTELFSKLTKFPQLFEECNTLSDFDRICSLIASIAHSASNSQKRLILARISEKLSEILQAHSEWGASAQLLVSILFDEKDI